MLICLLLLQLLSGGDYTPEMLSLTGASDIEELSEECLERFADLHARPVRINLASRSKLLACGLFSAYQTASLLDYRERNGAIRSKTELGLVDGFNAAAATALMPFISLDAARAPGEPAPRRFYQSLTVQGGLRQDRGSPAVWTGKAGWHGQWQERFELSFSTGGSCSAAWHGAHLDLVLGDYNARFGQGLALWTGFSLSGFASTSAFSRNPTGIKASAALSRAGRFRGAAAQFEAGPWTGSAFGSLSGLWGLHTGFTGRMLSAALNFCHEADWSVLAADAKYCLGGVSLAGEIAWEPGSTRPAALASLQWIPAYGSALSLLGRYYPAVYSGRYAAAPRSGTKTSDECGLSFGARNGWAELTADAAWHPDRQTRHARLLLKAAPRLACGGGELRPVLRWSWRVRPEERYPHKQDLRLDLAFSKGVWNCVLRGNLVWNRELAWLGYAETGLRMERGAVWLRAELFCADHWEDRIYVYERDAPGTFNVPARYGRGYSLSLYLSRRPWYLRLSNTGYPAGGKATRFEIKLALVWR